MVARATDPRSEHNDPRSGPVTGLRITVCVCRPAGPRRGLASLETLEFASNPGRAAASVLLVPLVLAVGCGEVSGGSVPASVRAPTGENARTGSPPARTRESTARCGSATKRLCVTAASQGRTLTAHVGWTVALELRRAGLTYGAPELTGAKALAVVTPVHRLGGAALATYRALAPGTVHMHTFARPLCRHGGACPDFIAVWQVTIRVLR